MDEALKRATEQGGDGEDVDENPRFVLRAFEDSNAVRLASILCELSDERSTRALSREHVAAVWTVQCPRHLHGSGKRNVNGRIREGLSYLKAARLVAVDGDTVTILDLPPLQTAASNLPIVTDEQGVSRPPSQWPVRPAVPDRLRAVQQTLAAIPQVSTSRETAAEPELVTWLRERIAELREAAEDAAGEFGSDGVEWEAYELSGKLGDAGWDAVGLDRHWQLHSPRAAQARCDAYDRVLARHRYPNTDDEIWMASGSCAGCGVSGDTDLPVTDELSECPELRDMAIAFRHRPGFREEWR